MSASNPPKTPKPKSAKATISRKGSGGSTGQTQRGDFEFASLTGLGSDQASTTNAVPTRASTGTRHGHHTRQPRVVQSSTLETPRPGAKKKISLGMSTTGSHLATPGRGAKPTLGPFQSGTSLGASAMTNAITDGGTHTPNLEDRRSRLKRMTSANKLSASNVMAGINATPKRVSGKPGVLGQRSTSSSGASTLQQSVSLMDDGTTATQRSLSGILATPASQKPSLRQNILDRSHTNVHTADAPHDRRARLKRMTSQNSATMHSASGILATPCVAKKPSIGRRMEWNTTTTTTASSNNNEDQDNTDHKQPVATKKPRKKLARTLSRNFNEVFAGGSKPKMVPLERSSTEKGSHAMLQGSSPEDLGYGDAAPDSTAKQRPPAKKGGVTLSGMRKGIQRRMSERGLVGGSGASLYAAAAPPTSTDGVAYGDAAPDSTTPAAEKKKGRGISGIKKGLQRRMSERGLVGGSEASLYAAAPPTSTDGLAYGDAAPDSTTPAAEKRKGRGISSMKKGLQRRMSDRGLVSGSGASLSSNQQQPPRRTLSNTSLTSNASSTDHAPDTSVSSTGTTPKKRSAVRRLKKGLSKRGASAFGLVSSSSTTTTTNNPGKEEAPATTMVDVDITAEPATADATTTNTTKPEAASTTENAPTDPAPKKRSTARKLAKTLSRRGADAFGLPSKSKSRDYGPLVRSNSTASSDSGDEGEPAKNDKKMGSKIKQGLSRGLSERGTMFSSFSSTSRTSSQTKTVAGSAGAAATTEQVETKPQPRPGLMEDDNQKAGGVERADSKQERLNRMQQAGVFDSSKSVASTVSSRSVARPNPFEVVGVPRQSHMSRLSSARLAAGQPSATAFAPQNRPSAVSLSSDYSERRAERARTMNIFNDDENQENKYPGGVPSASDRRADEQLRELFQDEDVDIVGGDAPLFNYAEEEAKKAHRASQTMGQRVNSTMSDMWQNVIRAREAAYSHDSHKDSNTPSAPLFTQDWNRVDQSVNLMDAEANRYERPNEKPFHHLSRETLEAIYPPNRNSGSSSLRRRSVDEEVPRRPFYKRRIWLLVFAACGIGVVLLSLMPVFQEKIDKDLKQSSSQQEAQGDGEDVKLHRPEVSDHEETPAVAAQPVPEEDTIQDVLVRYGLTDFHTLGDQSSSAYAAYQWLAKVDPAKLTPRDVQLPVRFIMANLYFATHPGDESINGRRRLGAPTNTQEWVKKDKWMTAAHICDWYGIKCDTNLPPGIDAVIEVKLTENNLHGYLPSQLGELTGLTALYLSHNHLSGSADHLLEKLVNLQILNLRANELTGTLPSTIASNKLESITLSNNHFGGSIPEAISSLSSLQHLSMGSNGLDGTIPSMQALTAMTSLQLDDNRLIGKIPTGIGAMINLRTLRLENNILTGNLPSEFHQVTELSLLYLGNNRLSGEIPEMFEGLNKISDLQLQRNRWRSALPTSIGALTGLKRLTLDGCGMTGSLPESWSALTELEALVVADNDLVGRIPTSYGNMASLHDMWLHRNFLQMEVPSELGQLNHLKDLYLDQNAFHGTLPDELGNIETLENLRISMNRVNGTVPDAVCDLVRHHKLKTVEADCENRVMCNCCTKCL